MKALHQDGSDGTLARGLPITSFTGIIFCFSQYCVGIHLIPVVMPVPI